jgi:hypothetical protein
MVRRYNQRYGKVAQFVPWKQKKTTEPAQIVPDYVQIRIRLSGELYNKITGVSDNISGFINFALLQHFALYDDIYFIRVSLAEIGEYMMKNHKPVKVVQNVPEVLQDLDEGEALRRLRKDLSLKDIYEYVKEKHPNIMLTPKEHLEIEKYYIKLINIIENEHA